MDIRLLTEQRRLSDEYLSTEKMLHSSEARIGAGGLEAAERAKIENDVNHTRDVLARLWDRILELDAAATVSAFKDEGP
jgi:hypothetical protein